MRIREILWESDHIIVVSPQIVSYCNDILCTLLYMQLHWMQYPAVSLRFMNTCQLQCTCSCTEPCTYSTGTYYQRVTKRCVYLRGPTAPEISKTERGRERPGLAHSAGEHTVLLCWRGRIWVHHCCCVLARCLGKEIKMFFPCYAIFIHSVPYNNVCEALNLLSIF